MDTKGIRTMIATLRGALSMATPADTDAKAVTQITDLYEDLVVEIERLQAELAEANSALKAEVLLSNKGLEREQALQVELAESHTALEATRRAGDDKIRELRSELAALKAQQGEPVGHYSGRDGEYGYETITLYEDIAEGAKLYTAAPAQSQDAKDAALLKDWLDFSSDVMPSCMAGHEQLVALRARTKAAMKEGAK